MKILYIANIRLPTEKAHGIQIMKMCEAFARLGHAVELVVPTRSTPITDDAFSYYGVERMFKITTLRVPDLVQFERLGFLFSALWFSEYVRTLHSFWNADVIYSRDSFVLLQYLLLGRKFIFEAHARPSFVSRLVAKRAYRVVVISNALKEVYVSAGVSEKKTIIAPDAVDEHFFDNITSKESARVALKLSPTAPIVVYTGHLYERKGVETLAQVATRLPNTQFLFIGGTVHDIKQFRTKWGNQPNITIVGHVSPTKVPQYLRAADVLVIPNSAKNQDASQFTSPMKLFEYMASGVPIIASDLPAIREILNKKNSVLVESDNPEAFAKGINKVLQNSDFANEISKQALKDVQNYTWQKRAESILDFIK